ncbi:MAG: agmatine deiminase family protein [Gallionella sp.]|nr:agmatine deiminase family protein [Gallionella sp.]MDP1939037.1 agmatine deiminase family protein [Gallionella sp.]
MLWNSTLCAAETKHVFSYPAEWESHDAIWLGFRTFAQGNLHELLLNQMIRSLAPHVRVKAIVEDESLLPAGRDYFTMRGLNPDNIDIVIQKHTDFWFRDPGPLFLTNYAGQLAIADFSYSEYANVIPEQYSPQALSDGKIDKVVALQLGLPSIVSRAVLEGGAFEVNGKGTILLSSMTAKRNPHLTRNELENEILRTLGQRKIIWLNEGLAEDPHEFSLISGKYWGRGAGGHTDEFVRFVNGSTVLLAWPSVQDRDANSISMINASRMIENHALLSKATDQNGEHFNIIHFPIPDLLIKYYQIPDAEIELFRQQEPALNAGDTVFLTAATSYLNYVISNDVILLPAYWHKGRPLSTRKKDQQAMAIMKKYFPERKIIQLDPTTLNFLGGGMHCITQQQPVIRH